MAAYKNTSKDLIAAYDKYFQRVGAPSILDQFEDAVEIDVEAIVNWRSSATVGATKHHRFNVHAWRPVDEEVFNEELLRGHFLLSKKIEPKELQDGPRPSRIRGCLSASGEAFLFRSGEVVDLDDHADLSDKMDQLLSETKFASERFGELVYDIRYNAFKGEVSHEGRAVLLEFTDTGKDTIAAQESKLAAFFESAGYQAECRKLLSGHQRVKQQSNPDTEMYVSTLRLTSNRVTSSWRFRAANIEWADVVGFYDEGKFVRSRVDHVEA